MKNNLLIFLLAVLWLLFNTVDLQAQWSIPKVIDSTVVGFDAKIAVSKNGEIAIICTDMLNTTLFRSNDYGQTFSHRVLPRPIEGGSSSFFCWIRPPAGLAFDTNNTLWFLWHYELYYDGVFEGVYIQLMKSVENKDTLITFWRTVKDFGIDSPRLVVDKSNNIHILYDTIQYNLTKQRYELTLQYLRFNEGKISNQFHATLPFRENTGGIPETADFTIQNDSVLHVTEGTIRYANNHYINQIEYTRSTNLGQTFSNFIKIDTTSNTIQYNPSVSITPQNQLLLLYTVYQTHNTQMASLSDNLGYSFTIPFLFETRPSGNIKRVIKQDSSFLYLFYNSGYGTVYNKMNNPNGTVEDSCFFDTLTVTDMAIGPKGEKYIVLKRSWRDNQQIYTYLSRQNIPVDINEKEKKKPLIFSVIAAPNPFNPTTTFFVDIQKSGIVKIEIYNILGKLVDQVNIRNADPGINKVKYNANHLSSGVYIVRAVHDENTSVTKILLLK